MTFEFGKIYEVNSEGKQYFDDFGDDCVGYYYVTPEEPISYDIQKCLVINKNKDTHPHFLEIAIPFKFADCKLCSLSSTAELKLFKVTGYIRWSGDKKETVIVALDEHFANVDDLNEVEVDYLGDYYGNLPAGSIIMSKEYD